MIHNYPLSPKLTMKQQAFCREYVKSGRVSDSYVAAYPGTKMNDRALSVQAARLMALPKIRLEIERIRLAASKRAEVTVDRVVREYAKLAFVDIRKVFDEAGNLKPIQELDDETAGAIADIEFEDLFVGSGKDRACRGRLAKIKLSDKRAALDSLAKVLGMFQEKNTAAPGTITWEMFQSLTATLVPPEPPR